MNEIYYATNRNVISEKPGRFGPVFNEERPFCYRVGKANVPRKRTSGEAWDDEYKTNAKSVVVFEESKGDDETPAVLGSKTAFDEIRRALTGKTGKRDILLYIHGFAGTFESGLERASQLKDEYRVPPRNPLNEAAGEDVSDSPREPLAIVFCWPSDGRTFGFGEANEEDERAKWAYFSDRDDAEASGKAIGRSFLRLIEFLRELSQDDKCRQRIHLVAHSMGVYALRHAVQEVKKQVDQARLPRLIDNAFLMAADEDADALAKDYKLGPLFELARQVHVYHAVDDLALIVSDTTKFNPDRLGERGPKNLSDDISRLHVIDCGKVSDTKLSHGRHQYYRFAPEVLRDVRQVLAGKPPDEIKGRDPIEPGRRYRLRRSKKLRAKVGAS